jgi:glycosyltransferase involved in cell wall biosynthesis
MISVAIPVYEMGNFGLPFLDESLKFLSNQTYQNFEVVISDHSKNTEIYEYINNHKYNFSIRYLKNSLNIGNSSANINNALKSCEGEIIKILFQDEFLYDKNTLEKIKNSFEQNPRKSWLLNGCFYGENIHNFKGKLNPTYTDNIIKGINTIGSPSALSILNSSKILFDEKIIWLMDCDYYKRCYDTLGEPIIINEPLVFVTQHKNQLTNIIPVEKKIEENQYIKNKYKL